MFPWSTITSDAPLDQPEEAQQHQELTVLDLLLPQNTSVDWDAVCRRAREYSHELKLRSGRHSPLFLAIQRDAPDFVIRAFLESFPGAAQEKQRIGLTPLHLAVARGNFSPDTIRCLIQACPESCSTKMSDGCVPLHFVRDVETAKLLLDAYPAALGIANKASYLPLHRVALASYAPPALVQLFVDFDQLLLNKDVLFRDNSQLSATTCQGDTPLEAVCQSFDLDIQRAEKLLKVQRQSATTHDTIPSATTSDDKDPIICSQKYRKMEILARASYLCNTTEEQISTNNKRSDSDDDSAHNDAPDHRQTSFCILHALLQSGAVSTLVLRYILEQHPDYLAKVDMCGRTAISIAASRRETPSETFQLLRDVIAKSDILDGANNSNMAMMVDSSGRLPLHLMIASGRRFDTGMNFLFQSDPMALTTLDRMTGLYPFMLAAASDRIHYMDRTTTTADIQRVETVFKLIREAPWLIVPAEGLMSTTAYYTNGSILSSRGRACLRNGQDAAKVAGRAFWCFLLPIIAAVAAHYVLTTRLGFWDWRDRSLEPTCA